MLAKIFRKQKKLSTTEIANHFLDGFVSGFCQPGGRWSITLYPSDGSMGKQNEAFRIGEHLAGVLNGKPIPEYANNGELLRWLQDNVPSLVIKQQINTEPDTGGQCNHRWASKRCSRELGHFGNHGIDLGSGFILAPWPSRE